MAILEVSVFCKKLWIIKKQKRYNDNYKKGEIGSDLLGEGEINDRRIKRIRKLDIFKRVALMGEER